MSLPAPSGLHQSTLAGANIRRGEWLSTGNIRLSVNPTTQVRGAKLQVAFERNNAHFSGTPDVTGRATSGRLSVQLRNLKSGAYRWWGRLYNGNAISKWVRFSPMTALGVQTGIPTSPRITSSTNPVQTKIYRSPRVVFNWSQPSSRISGYWYSFSDSTKAPGSPYVKTRGTSVSFGHVPTGTFVFEIRAENLARVWSPPARYTVRTDTTPPTISNLSFSTFDFNPFFTPLTTSFTVDRPATVRIGFYGSGGHAVRLVVVHTHTPAQQVRYVWHGRDNQGHAVAPGTYSMYVRVTDALGNTSLRGYSGLTVIDKRILVSLSQQRLWAYDGRHLFITSLVTTGNKALPTPTGIFSILVKFHPFTFISPFPKGAWDYYAPSPVNYAMMFQSGGYYIHDAPWRSVFGPGTNSESGAPGATYTGTHGCVNVPLNVAQSLFYWAPDGTPVQVVK